MKDLKITKGEWQIETYANYVSIQDGPGYKGEDVLNIENFGVEIVGNNARLICDAGNTAQKCNLLPSELLKQRDAFKVIFERLIVWHKRYPPERVYSYHEAPGIENALTEIIDAAQAIITKAEER